MHRLTIACLTAAGFILIGSAAQAQSNSLFGNRGPLSQGQSTGSASGFGATGAAGTGLGGGAGRAGGTAGTGGAGAAPAFGAAATQTPFGAGRQGFVGRADNAGRFVGNAVAGSQSGTGGQTSQFSFDTAGPQNLNNNFNNGGRQFGGTTRTSSIRPQQRIAFEYNALQAPETSATLQNRYTKLQTKRPELAGVDVAVDGDALVLRGIVSTEEHRRLAELFARLEPGVRNVRNEIVVAPPAK